MRPSVTQYHPTDPDIIHALADDLPVGLWVARAPSGELVYANRQFADIMGMAARDDVAAGGYSQPYRIYTRDGAPYPEERLPFARALAERQTVVVDDITIHRDDGSKVDLRAFARPVATATGVISHVVVAFFDISREVAAERARAESDHRAQLAQRMEAIATLAGGIAHDFNNLILGIKLLASQLALDENNPERKQALAMIDDVTERASALSRSLLGFARRGKHRSAPIALDDVAGGMITMLRRTIAGVEIRLDLAAGDATVIGDRSQIEQVIMNLVVNARDAVAERDDGLITVRTRLEGRAVILEIADNGPGIPPAIRERVFEPYFTTKSLGPGRGTGLGLATVFGIVESHGGSIAIHDGAAGRGTAMRVTLPAGPRLPEAATVRMPVIRRSGGASGTILVVDDDDMVRRALQLSLASLGYDTLAAGSGAAAVDLLAQHTDRVRGVLLDMVMPGMGGRATYLALRQVRPALPVILISGYAMNEEVQAILDLGVRGFLQKPCSIEALGAALDDVLPVAAS
jgi:two-component system cell cycle sensor histidine kinase/response regulator CckA